jgi:hypothetical protein
MFQEKGLGRSLPVFSERSKGPFQFVCTMPSVPVLPYLGTGKCPQGFSVDTVTAEAGLGPAQCLLQAPHAAKLMVVEEGL